LKASLNLSLSVRTSSNEGIFTASSKPFKSDRRIVVPRI